MENEFHTPPYPSGSWMSIGHGAKTNLTTPETKSDIVPLFSDDQRALAGYIIGVWLTSLMGYLGIVDNFLTIVVFVKLGFQDTTNISMTFLAVWDLVKCFCSCIFRLRSSVGRLTSPAIELSYYQVTGTSFMLVSMFSSSVSAALAGYVAIERALCVSKPFLVRQILTPKVTIVVNTVLSIVVFGSQAVNFSQYTLKWSYIDYLNATVLLRTPNSLFLPELVTYYNVLSISWPLSSFIVICVCTVVIFYYLKRASKFRTQMAGPDTVNVRENFKSNQLTSRDKRIIKMLFVILVVYIITLLPQLFRYMVKIVIPQFKHYGAYNNSFLIVTDLMHFFALINAAANPFVFYIMSSQFRTALHSLILWRRKTTTT